MLSVLFDQLRFAASIAFGARIRRPLARAPRRGAVCHTARVRHRNRTTPLHAVGSGRRDQPRAPTPSLPDPGHPRRERNDPVLSRAVRPPGNIACPTVRVDIARIPLTTKEALRADPDGFVRRQRAPAHQFTTTGTTGPPTRVLFSDHELRSFVALAAMSLLVSGMVGDEDVVQISTSARAASATSVLAVPAPGSAPWSTRSAW